MNKRSPKRDGYNIIIAESLSVLLQLQLNIHIMQAQFDEYSMCRF